MADRPTFSIVVATHNSARTLPSTVRSVLAQTRSDFELIVVDDGSTDGTERVLADLPDRRLSYVQQQNLGPAAARNAGIERAAGEYVSLLDSDDLWLPHYLETMGAALERNVDAGLAYTDAWRLDDVTRRIHRATAMSQQRPPKHPPADPQVILAALLENNFVYTSTTVRRSVLLEVGGFRRFTRSEDYELWLRIAASGTRFVNANAILAVYRVRPGSRIHDPRAMHQGRAEIYRHVLETYPLTDATRAVAERRLREEAAAIADLIPHEGRAPEATTRARLPPRLQDLRTFRRRPPRLVAEAFPDLTTL